ncbi:MAG: PCRF domain-containing protein [Nanoarchaeota archaeon]
MGLEDLRQRLERGVRALEASFDEQKAVRSLDELLSQIEQDSSNVRNFETYGRVEHKLDDFRYLIGRSSFIRDFSLQSLSRDEIEDAEKEVKEYLEKVENFILREKLTGVYDEKGTIITLQLGTAGIRTLNPIMKNLAKAYKEFAKEREFNIDEAGDDEREISFVVKGSYGYGYFKGEHGVHRVIFEDDNGKRQTNYLTVIVEPLVESNGFTIKDSDIKYEVLAASTPGGSNANTGNTGIRAKHLPTGITALSRRKSQNNNIKVAREVLFSRVALHYKTQEKTQGEERVNPVRGNHFRTYSLTGKKYIRDDRTGFQTGVEDFLKGNISEFIYNFHGVCF